MKDYIIAKSGRCISGYQDVKNPEDYADYAAHVELLRTMFNMLHERLFDARLSKTAYEHRDNPDTFSSLMRTLGKDEATIAKEAGMVDTLEILCLELVDMRRKFTQAEADEIWSDFCGQSND